MAKRKAKKVKRNAVVVQRRQECPPVPRFVPPPPPPELSTGQSLLLAVANTPVWGSSDPERPFLWPIEGLLISFVFGEVNDIALVVFAARTVWTPGLPEAPTARRSRLSTVVLDYTFYPLPDAQNRYPRNSSSPTVEKVLSAMCRFDGRHVLQEARTNAFASIDALRLLEKAVRLQYPDLVWLVLSKVQHLLNFAEWRDSVRYQPLFESCFQMEDYRLVEIILHLLQRQTLLSTDIELSSDILNAYLVATPRGTLSASRVRWLIGLGCSSFDPLGFMALPHLWATQGDFPLDVLETLFTSASECVLDSSDMLAYCWEELYRNSSDEKYQLKVLRFLHKYERKFIEDDDLPEKTMLLQTVELLDDEDFNDLTIFDDSVVLKDAWRKPPRKHKYDTKSSKLLGKAVAILAKGGVDPMANRAIIKAARKGWYPGLRELWQAFDGWIETLNLPDEWPDRHYFDDEDMLLHECRNIDVMNFLVSKGVISAEPRPCGRTELQQACMKGDSFLIEFFLGCLKVDPLEQPEGTKQPLMYLAEEVPPDDDADFHYERRRYYFGTSEWEPADVFQAQMRRVQRYLSYLLPYKDDPRCVKLIEDLFRFSVRKGKTVVQRAPEQLWLYVKRIGIFDINAPMQYHPKKRTPLLVAVIHTHIWSEPFIDDMLTKLKLDDNIPDSDGLTTAAYLSDNSLLKDVDYDSENEDGEGCGEECHESRCGKVRKRRKIVRNYMMMRSLKPTRRSLRKRMRMIDSPFQIICLCKSQICELSLREEDLYMWIVATFLSF